MEHKGSYKSGYTDTRMSRVAKTDKVNPMAEDTNRTKPEVMQEATENRSHADDGRLTGTKG